MGAPLPVQAGLGCFSADPRAARLTPEATNKGQPVIPDIPFGPHVLRIRQTKPTLWEGIIVGRAKDRFAAPTREELLTRLQQAAMADTKGFVGMEGARARFLTIFPQGFHDPYYIGVGKGGERDYKVELARRVQEELPLDRLSQVADAPEIARRLFQSINLADQFTKSKLADVLRGPKANRFLRIAAEFALGSVTRACAVANAELADEGVNTWVCLTFFPFFWRPDAHVFLKPEFTRQFAERIGDPFQFAYESRPNPETYLALLQMTERLRRELADLGPRDNIDLHSFMFATNEYTEADVRRIVQQRAQEK